MDSRCLSLLALAVAMVPLAACKPAAPDASTASLAPRTAAIDAALVAKCASFPTTLVAASCVLDARGSAGTAAFCVQLAPATAPRLSLFTVLLYRGASRYEADVTLPPRMADMLDAGPELARYYAGFEGPKLLDVAPGRRATWQSRGAMLGGALEWTTLRSADGTHDLVLAVDQVLKDYPVTPAELGALRSLDAASAVRCLDAALW